jgi:hypothetical protein
MEHEESTFGLFREVFPPILHLRLRSRSKMVEPVEKPREVEAGVEVEIGVGIGAEVEIGAEVVIEVEVEVEIGVGIGAEVVIEIDVGIDVELKVYFVDLREDQSGIRPQLHCFFLVFLWASQKIKWKQEKVFLRRKNKARNNQPNEKAKEKSFFV